MFDSDTMMITNNKILIKGAKKHYKDFLVPTRLVDSIKVARRYTSDDQANLDIKTGINKIGEIINLSQKLNTLIWDKINSGSAIKDVMDIYYDVAMLDVMSNLEIDMAKKEFPVNNPKELADMTKKYKEYDSRRRQIKPNFFSYVDRDKNYYDNGTKYYKFHKTTMDYLQRIMNRDQRRGGKNVNIVPFSETFKEFDYNINKVSYSQVERILSLVYRCNKEMKRIWENKTIGRHEQSLFSDFIKQNCIDDINTIDMNTHTMIYLLKCIESEEHTKIRRRLFNILFGSPNTSFYNLLKESQQNMNEIVESDDGTLDFYGVKFAKTLQKRGVFEE